MADPLGALPDGLHEQLLREIIEDLFSDRSRELTPAAYFVGGQPGAGKSNAIIRVNKARREGSELPVIQGDDLRLYHPQYEEFMQRDDRTMSENTRHDANRWTNEVIDHAARNGFSFIAELSMRDPDRTVRVLSRVKGANVEVNLIVLAVHRHWSLARTLGRYYMEKSIGGTARYVSPEIHDQGCRELERSLLMIRERNLADHLMLVDHSGNILFDSNEQVARSCIDCFRENTSMIHDQAELRTYVDSVITRIRLVPADERTHADILSLERIHN
ncbi:MAG: zeta toxin family protein [Nevskia sp.]|nr:zeta toxin family protein [Nevskia sp.]